MCSFMCSMNNLQFAPTKTSKYVQNGVKSKMWPKLDLDAIITDNKGNGALMKFVRFDYDLCQNMSHNTHIQMS